MPGQHLVIVGYHQFDFPGNDWVYNNPDIDSSKVVWARDMGVEANRELLRYYSGRQVWFTDRQPPFPLLTYEQAIRSMAVPGAGGDLALSLHPPAASAASRSH